VVEPDGPRPAIRVLLVDDEPLVRSGIAMILSCEDDIDVVGQAGAGDDAARITAGLRPDVILMDVRMPGADGVATTRRLVDEGLVGGAPGLARVLVLTTFHVEEAVYGALRAGAVGFILKEAVPEELIAAVRAVAADEGWLDPAVARRLITEFARRPEDHIPTPAMVRQLTAREQDVVVHIAFGLTNREVAERLYIGEVTVKSHLAHVMTKLHLRNRSEVVMVAYQTGLVKPNSRLPAREDRVGGLPRPRSC
jgi:DNA-binding NarL/FixJ family response regulator